MQREHDPEPERYYDWMLWKMRQERAMEDPVDDVTVHNQLTKWTQKSTTVNMTTEEMYRREITDMNRQLYTLMIKVTEMREEIENLKYKVEILGGDPRQMEFKF